MIQLKSAREPGKITSQHWDDLVSYVKDTFIGHNHDGENSRKIDLPPLQYNLGATPLGHEFGMELERETIWYGGVFIGPTKPCSVFFQACFGTDKGTARAHLCDAETGDIIKNTMLECRAANRFLYSRMVTLEPGRAYSAKFVSDIGNTCTVWQANIVVKQ